MYNSYREPPKSTCSKFKYCNLEENDSEINFEGFG